MKKALTIALTGLALVGALLLAGRKQKTSQAVNKPEDVIWSMMDASRAGDVPSYLACFAEDLDRTLRKTAETMTETAFSDYLKQTSREIKGVALSNITSINDEELKIRLEFVYQDKNEVQYYHLKRVGDAWKIRYIEGSERVKTLVPYGTEVFPIPQDKKRKPVDE